MNMGLSSRPSGRLVFEWGVMFTSLPSEGLVDKRRPLMWEEKKRHTGDQVSRSCLGGNWRWLDVFGW